MKWDRKEARALILKTLAHEVDGVLFPAGFRRTSKSLTYERKLKEDGFQKVVFEIVVSPAYLRDGVHLRAYVDIGWARPVDLLRAMLPPGEGELFTFLCRLAIDAMMPVSTKAWLLRERDDFVVHGDRLARFFEGTLVPQLNELTTEDQFMELVEKVGSGNISLPDYSWTSAAAILASRGRIEDARQAIVTNMSSVSQRQAHALRYLDQIELSEG